jgi:hypothetical protein
MKLRRFKIGRDPGGFTELAQLEREAFSDHRLSPSRHAHADKKSPGKVSVPRL